jgi:type IV pilus assembly protein PilW
MLSRAQRCRPARRLCQAGLSLVELMVGIAVGLFIVAAATVVVTSQLSDNRRLLLETQLQQDLRASGDIVAREVRRASAWGPAEQGVWFPGRAAAAVAVNPFNEITAEEGGSAIEFKYHRGPGAEGPYGFRLTGTGVIQTRLADSGWQDLTDGRVMTVTRFDVTMTQVPSDPLPCPRLCDDGTTNCWPQLVTRTVRIEIEAEARADANVRRSVTAFVRPRNDEIRSNNGASLCP